MRRPTSGALVFVDVSRALLASVSLLVAVGCGGGDDRADAEPADAPRPDVLDCTDPMADGCACDDPGLTICMGTGGTQCCVGRWWSFLDGPCMSIDAGVPICGARPEIGCPCETEGEIDCRLTEWRLICSGGTWTQDGSIAAGEGHVCC